MVDLKKMTLFDNGLRVKEEIFGKKSPVFGVILFMNDNIFLGFRITQLGCMLGLSFARL